MRKFLTTLWGYQWFQTWEVEPDLLLPYLPHKIGLYTERQKAIVSIVASFFENTKVKGIQVPFHVSFPQIDLRFYVEHKNSLGIGFIKQIVPRYCISLWANRIFNEKYVTLPLEFQRLNHENGFLAFYKLWNKKQYNSIEIFSTNDLKPLEHDLYNDLKWGFSNDSYKNLLRYRIEAGETYQTFNEVEASINFEYDKLFGNQWGFLKKHEPIHSFFLAPNKVKIYQPEILIGERYAETKIQNNELVLVLS